MNSESTLVLEIWELVRDSLPVSRRTDIAVSILRAFEEFGFESEDLNHLQDEDEYLTAAHRVVFGGEDEEEDQGYGEDWDE